MENRDFCSFFCEFLLPASSASSLRSAPGGSPPPLSSLFWLLRHSLRAMRPVRRAAGYSASLVGLASSPCHGVVKRRRMHLPCTDFSIGSGRLNAMCIDDWVYFLRCRANSRRCLRRCLAFGYVARCCSRRNARLSCGADNGGRNTFPHTISPFTPFNSVLLRSGAFRFLKPDCVAWLLLNNR